MNKTNGAKQLATEILARSRCSVQVGAAIADDYGIISWGWNGPGFDGFGLHAERHAILRANKRRLPGATIYVASVRGKNGKIVMSKPCPECQQSIDNWGLKVKFRNARGEWE